MFSFLLLAAAASGQADAPASAKPKRKVCRTNHEVNSRVTTRTCKTLAEWQKEGQTMDSMGRIQMEQSMGLSGRLVNPGCPSGWSC